MTTHFSLSEAANLSDPRFRLGMMREVVEHVHARGDLYMPLLNLVTTFIDGLAAGRPQATKKAYLQYIKTHFPALCAEIPAKEFYENYRNGAVHEFSLKDGYGIGRDTGMGGKYIITQTARETGRTYKVLNIDRLVADFVAHVRALEAALPPA